MSDTTLMTDQTAATTTEGQAASQSANQSATGADQGSQQQAAGSQQQSTEGQQQQSGDANAQGARQQQQEKKPEGAPEKYDFKAAEGQAFDTQVLEQFSEVAKDLNLTQDAAQKLLDKMAPAIQSRQQEQFQSIREDWANQARSDKEFGGDKLPENLAMAQKAMDQFGTAEFKTLLNQSGMGNHPEVIRFMVRAGKAISEDRIVTGGSGAATQTDPRNLYAKSNMNP
jgi:hypothetical protein